MRSLVIVCFNSPLQSYIFCFLINFDFNIGFNIGFINNKKIISMYFI